MADLQQTEPGPGLLQVACRLAGQCFWVAVTLSAWQQQAYGLFAVGALLGGLWFASFMSLTHDAVHHTLTGIPVLDEVLARMVSWPMTWPIGVYAHAHALHHKLNGVDPRDPERVQPTEEEYARASPVKRWFMRHQLEFRIFVAGAFGLVSSLLLGALSRARTTPALRRVLLLDALGIALTTTTIYGTAYLVGGSDLVVGVLLQWLIYERCVGVAHQFRVHAEHYGRWQSRGNFLDTQYAATRNIESNALLRLFYNHLNRHAVHHMFARIPFYRLEEANRRLGDLYAQAGNVTHDSSGYLEVWHEMRDAQARRNFIRVSAMPALSKSPEE
ncbi:fatty acid desaturase [Archangium sp.]|uniref:fatty acid desaturase family protein n=1 Tax=Archangium sp. TaxID=1872627 RepID=UPI002D669164|nr:fatty acid desaturase [Archangium sp.]HYO55947.1 fatty acid desaturase [Archangium sp.]